MKETTRQRWVRRTRESTARALAKDDVPLSAQALEDNLDISWYGTGIGFVDTRTEREISAALQWLVKQGYAVVVTERDPDDPPGKLYEITREGAQWAHETSS